MQVLNAGAVYFALVFGAGFVALGMLLAAEFTMALKVRGLSISEYFASQDPVSGTVYAVLLGVFAVMPLLVARRQR
jgi:hypothetical protein